MGAMAVGGGFVRECAVAVLVTGAAFAARAQVIEYDLATGVLSIPSVSVGSASFTGVTLQDIGNFTFRLQAAAAQVPAAPGMASFDAASGLVTLPAVRVGGDTYLDVTLRHLGDYVFALQSATPLPAETLAGASQLLQANDGLWAQAVPASGAVRMAFTDGCYLHDGRSRAYVISDTDANQADYVQRDAYRIGQRSINLQVLARRLSTNPDGSVREELDVLHDVAYTDGTAGRHVTTTMVRGSSSGTPRCTTPQSGSDWRVLGNQQLVQTAVRPRNVRDERYALSSGAPLSPKVQYRRDVQWTITDPMGHATYVIVTGPGPGATVDGVAQPFSLKFLSPRLLRSAAELAGKPGNYLNWSDDDTFRFCRVEGSGVPVAAAADCTGLGATAYDWGVTTGTPDALADAEHAALGFVDGATYLFQVYDDDGWKTVNGQLGRAPIATYAVTLEHASYTFVEMAGGGVSADKFPRLAAVGQTPVQLRQNLASASPKPVNLAWPAIPALSDGRAFGFQQAWEYFHGPKAGNPAGVGFPAYRYQTYRYPGSLATTLAAMPVTARPAELKTKTYSEITLQAVDRNDSHILSRLSFN